jgi:hypothetical protein
MERKERTYKVKTLILGGGLCLREGQIVSEHQLAGYTDWLRREGGIEEIHEQGHTKSDRHQANV